MANGHPDESEKYAVVLTDYDGDANATVIEDKVVWDWLNESTTFPPGVSSVRVPLPDGYTFEDGEKEAHITVGSADNDRWLYASGIRRPDGSEATKSLDVYRPNKVYKELLRLGVKDEHIIEGMEY